ncbi:hypothetical protein BDP67DRAFT_583172 [Colletotrichum lupini]|nr:hypothetical protein BDP67DRAFT_583172 [Colletotrichum lupini]
MVAVISGRVFIGPKFCHKEEYLEASTMFVVDLFQAVAKINRWPKFLRFIGKQYVPEIKNKFGMGKNEQLAETQLSLSIVAIHTTTMAATHTLYDIAARCPDVIPALRKEVQSVLAANENEWSTT